MGYPTQWAQVVIGLPESFPIYGGFPINPVCCLHFTYSPALPLGWSSFLFQLDVDAWVNVWLKRLVYDQVASQTYYCTYIATPPSGYIKDIFFGNLFLNAAAILPSTQCVVMRLEAAGSGPRNRGRKFLSPIRASFTRDGVLTSAGATQANAVASLMLLPLISQGVTFTLVIPSFADDAAKPVVRIRWNYRLGLVKRRGRQKDTTAGFFSVPFDLPP